jgi:hypothetical protein
MPDAYTRIFLIRILLWGIVWTPPVGAWHWFKARQPRGSQLPPAPPPLAKLAP